MSDTINKLIGMVGEMDTIRLETRLAVTTSNITWYMGQFEFWTGELEYWVNTTSTGDMISIPMERMDANEAMVKANLSLWYAIMEELTMRRFTMEGGYMGEVA